MRATTTLTGNQTIWFYATPPASPVHPFDVFHAQALNSSLAQADLLVKYSASTETTFPRSVYVTTPYPVFRGENATFGVVFANGAENTTVTNVTLAIPGGYDFEHNGGRGAPLFQTGWRASTGDGEWFGWDAKHASWTGSRDLGGLDATSWFVDVPITNDVSVATALDGGFRSLPEVNASFPNGFSMTSTRWGAVPGILRLDVPNASLAAGSTPPRDNGDGYPHDAGAPGYSFGLAGSTARAHVTGAGSYGLGATSANVVQLQSSVANSTFNVSRRAVPLGSDVTLAGDLQSILTTLAQQGATDANLTLDIYAPPSMGCVPTASWTWSAGSLPVAPIDDLAVWHAAEAGDVVFAASQDGHVYEVLPGGVAGWQWKAPATPTKLALSAFAGATRLLVGDASGAVSALDPTSGALRWSTPVGSGAVAALQPNATTGATLVAAGPALARVGFDGGIGAAATFAPDAVAQAQDAPDGGAVALVRPLGTAGQDARLVRLDPAFALVASAPHDAGLGFAVGSGGILSVQLAPVGSTAVVLDPDDLRVLQSRAEPTAQLGAAGDATGDGVADLAIVTGQSTLVVLDGRDGSEAWTFDTTQVHGVVDAPAPSPPTYSPGGPGVGLPPSGCGDQLVAFSRQIVSASPCAGVSIGDLAFTPTRLAAGSGRVALVAQSENDAGVFLDVGDNGTLVWRKTSLAAGLPNAIRFDGYAGAPVVVAGTEDGRVLAYLDDPTGAALLDAKPSSEVGRFSFALHVPMGGFFGSHLAIATLSWSQAGAPQAAHLADWFEVVQPDGTPRTHPTYRVALVVADRSAKGASAG